jgi:tape measure domain-containing protein
VADASLTIAIKTDPADPLGNLGKQAKEAEREVEGLGSAFAKVGVALGGLAALKGTFDFVLNATREMEDLTTQFVAFTGSAQGAQKQLEKLSAFAASSPFELAEVATANRTLLAFGSTTGQSIEQLRQLGEVSAATGTDLSDLATIFGQVQAEGKLTGERFNQLVERGINIGPELAKSLGVASTSIRGLISDSAITSDEVSKAFQKMTSEGGQFFGSTDRLSKTVSGSISTLKDSVSILASEIGKQGAPAFAQYAQGLTAVIDSIREFVQERNKLAASPEEQQIQKLKDRLQELEGIFQNLSNPKGSIKQTLTSLLFTGGEAGLESEKRKIAEKIKAVNQEIIGLTTERNKRIEEENKKADDAETKRLNEKKVAKESGLASDLAAKGQEERDKAATLELARLQEKEKKITEISLQEEAVREAILAEQQTANDEIKLAALQERESQLTSARVQLEAERLEQLKQFDQAELLRLNDTQNKKFLATQAAEKKRNAEIKKAQDEEFNLFVQTENARKLFEQQTYAQRAQTAQKGLSAIAELTKSKSREAFELGKAAAIAQAAISIPVTAIEAYKSLAGIPIVGPGLGAIAAAAAIAIGTSRLNEIRSQRFAFAEGGIVPGVGNKDTVPALLTPGEVVVPKSNFEDLQKSLQGGVTADQIVLLQQSNEIQAKILDTITFGTVNDKLTQIIAGLSRVADRVDAISIRSGSDSSGSGDTATTPAEPPQVTIPEGPGRISPNRNRERVIQKSKASDL